MEKERKKGWGLGTLKMGSSSDSWALPHFWPRREGQTARPLSVLSEGVSPRLPGGTVGLLHMC